MRNYKIVVKKDGKSIMTLWLYDKEAETVVRTLMKQTKFDVSVRCIEEEPFVVRPGKEAE